MATREGELGALHGRKGILRSRVRGGFPTSILSTPTRFLPSIHQHQPPSRVLSRHPRRNSPALYCDDIHRPFWPLVRFRHSESERAPATSLIYSVDRAARTSSSYFPFSVTLLGGWGQIRTSEFSASLDNQLSAAKPTDA
jgi:hypothetical protein